MAGERSYCISNSLVLGATYALKHVTTSPRGQPQPQAPRLREEVKFVTFCFFFLSLWEINTYRRGKMKPGAYPQSSF